MKKNKSPEASTILNSNFFVMDRPSKKNEGSMTIKTASFHKELSEKEELMQDALYDVVLNLGNRLTKEDHFAALRIVTPIFALHLFSEAPEQANEILESFLKDFPDKSANSTYENIKSIKEEVSQLEAIMKINFHLFIESKKRNMPEALKEFDDFIADIESLWEHLPLCYSFNLIEHLMLCEEKYKKTRSRKK